MVSAILSRASEFKYDERGIPDPIAPDKPLSWGNPIRESMTRCRMGAKGHG
jgi:hypothetical protein